MRYEPNKWLVVIVILLLAVISALVGLYLDLKGEL